MTARRTVRRSGYTLIELLVASAIATLLMLALYSAFDLTVTQTEIGRERVAHTDLARSVISRMSGDLTVTLGILPPQSGQSAGNNSSQQSADPSTTDTGTVTLLPFQGGVVGTDQQLTLFVSKVPRSLLELRPSDPKWSNATTLLPPDLKRVTYYMASSGVGLCRQERPWLTAAGTGDVTTLDTSMEEQEVIAPEVTAVSFSYLDGTSEDGVSEWDGTAASADGVTPVTGPPRAVKVTLDFATLDDRGQTVTKRVVHVFPLRAAIGNASSSTGSQ